MAWKCNGHWYDCWRESGQCLASSPVFGGCIAALASIPRGVLHVMLTKPGEAGLALSKDAEAEREAAAAAVAGFLEAAAGESLVNVEPRATATAVNAQLRAVQPALLDSGAFTIRLRGPSFLPCCESWTAGEVCACPARRKCMATGAGQLKAASACPPV